MQRCSEVTFGRATTAAPVSFILRFLLKRAIIQTKACHGCGYPPERRAWQGGKTPSWARSPTSPDATFERPPFPGRVPALRSTTVGTSRGEPIPAPTGPPHLGQAQGLNLGEKRERQRAAAAAGPIAPCCQPGSHKRAMENGALGTGPSASAGLSTSPQEGHSQVSLSEPYFQ